jgi:hypothetical protein
MDLFLTFFGGKPVPPQVDKFTCFVPCPFSAPSPAAVVVAPLSSLARRRPPSPAAVVVAPLSSLARRRPHSPAAVVVAPLSSLARRRPPSPAAVVVAPALVPCLSASALACRRHRPRRRHRRRRMRPTDHRRPAAARAFAVLSASSSLVTKLIVAL